MSQMSDAEIEELIAKLGDADAVVRLQAREELVATGGHDITRALVVALDDHRRDIRWEAAKALVGIGDAIAAPALTHHLHDEDIDVRWLAAEGVAELGEAGLLSTLNAAIRHAREPEFCKAAHHAFKQFKKHETHADKLDEVIEACEMGDAGIHVPVAAYKVIQQIREK